MTTSITKEGQEADRAERELLELRALRDLVLAERPVNTSWEGDFHAKVMGWGSIRERADRAWEVRP